MFHDLVAISLFMSEVMITLRTGEYSMLSVLVLPIAMRNVLESVY
jgi:hypothetical protein